MATVRVREYLIPLHSLGRVVKGPLTDDKASRVELHNMSIIAPAPARFSCIPLFCSSPVAYGVEFVEEIKSYGKVETCAQKWPVVRARAGAGEATKRFADVFSERAVVVMACIHYRVFCTGYH